MDCVVVRSRLNSSGSRLLTLNNSELLSRSISVSNLSWTCYRGKHAMLNIGLIYAVSVEPDTDWADPLHLTVLPT
ncbi:hypothetical protein VCR4J2_340043 [Vibrio coralliirubri]|nr:hypothetical protein VCR4J2_340043 [Vibrio coralliirubri]